MIGIYRRILHNKYEKEIKEKNLSKIKTIITTTTHTDDQHIE